MSVITKIEKLIQEAEEKIDFGKAADELSKKYLKGVGYSKEEIADQMKETPTGNLVEIAKEAGKKIVDHVSDNN
jgi:hypothetical protein